MSEPTSAPAYKDITLRQLASFCETARLGSLTGAARALRLAHPTVWKQVHALEEHLGVPLVEPHARGCRLTDEGRVLAELAGPLVTDIHRLQDQFGREHAKLSSHLSVAAPSRLLTEAIPEVVADLTRARPDVRLALRHMEDDFVAGAVESGEADLGLTGTAVDTSARPLLSCSLCYEVEVMVIAPPRHPLSKRKAVRPADLKAYPIVNGRTSFRDPSINVRLERYGLFDGPRRVEAFNGFTIQEYVRRGYGIGLIGCSPYQAPFPGLWRRSMARWFGRAPVYLVTKKRPKRGALVAAFVDRLRARQSPNAAR